MGNIGKLRLKIRDSAGKPLQDRVDIRLEHQHLRDLRVVDDADASRDIVITDLHAAPQGFYKIQIDPSRHDPAGRFVNIQPSGETELVIELRGRASADDLEPHREHLADVPPEYMINRLRSFRLDPELFIDLPPLVCGSHWINREMRSMRRHVAQLDIVSFDDLKNWVGVPNAVAKKRLRAASDAVGSASSGLSQIRAVPHHLLPAGGSFVFENLEPDQKRAVRQVASNLLYGYVEEEELRRPPFNGVVEYMLERASNMYLFVLPDLVVCPGDKVVFSDFAVLLYNNILVYGDGEIVPGNHTKVYAYQIKHVHA